MASGYEGDDGGRPATSGSASALSATAAAVAASAAVARQRDVGGSAKVFKIKFGQVYLSKPTTVEKDGTVTNMFPHEARLRNLTYAAPLYVDVVMNEYRVARDVNVGNPAEIMGDPVSTEEARKEFLGYVPIMLKG